MTASRWLALLPLFFLVGIDGAYGQSAFPIRGAFYYPWYPATWSVEGAHVFYKPDLGYYGSSDPAVIDRHIQALAYAKIDVAIASWWGAGQQSEAERWPLLMDRTLAAGSGMKWAIYYEKEGFGNPSVSQIQSDLAYVKKNYAGHQAYAHVDGKPVVFVYDADDTTCEVADRWDQAAHGEWYVSLKVVGAYRSCSAQPSTWHQYGPDSPAQRHSGFSFVIAPGFWRADATAPLLARDPVRFGQNVRDMVKSGEPWQLITTFNEWGEGTAVEGAEDWKSASGFGLYLDALHNDGNPASAVVSGPKPAGKRGPASRRNTYTLTGRRLSPSHGEAYRRR